jgi:hypothetical protein
MAASCSRDPKKKTLIDSSLSRRVSSDLAGAFNRSRSGGSLPVLVGPACVLSLSVSDTLDPPPPLVPGSHEKDNVDAILKRGQHAVTTPT